MNELVGFHHREVPNSTGPDSIAVAVFCQYP
jgi:hypothetical protein